MLDKAAADGSVALIDLPGPARGHRVDANDLARLAAEIRAGAASAHVVVLRADGEDFVRGRVAPSTGDARPTALELRELVAEPVLELVAAIDDADVPVLAVVQGAAHGVGCAIAGGADVTLAGERATFALPELDRDLPPLLALTALRTRVPSKALLDLVLSSRTISAAEGLRLGLVTYVVPDDELVAAVDQYCQRLASISRPALVAVKRYLRHAGALPRSAAAELAANLLPAVLASAADPGEPTPAS
jgi:enoyl-CoA hydratase/carnithine racemase